MSRQLTLSLTTSAISSPVSRAGPSHSSSQVGQQSDLSGRAVSHVRLSARQAKELGLMTTGTYGQRSFGSSSSVALQSSLASRLVQKLPLNGGISWRLTWKERTTPHLRQICQLQASGLHTNGADYFGWPTPKASREGKERIDMLLKGQRRSGAAVQMGLARAAQLAVWSTPTVNDSKNNGSPSQMLRKAPALNCQAQLAAWSTPLASDGKSLKRSPLVNDMM